jgi:hypothetical protein
MKKIPTLWWAIGLIVVIGGLFVWSAAAQNSDPNIVSQRGFHWHPTLTIYVKGEKQEIPANIGIGAQHQPMHTHPEDATAGVIHLEFAGAAKRGDLMLGQFFKNWGKDMRSFGTNMKMTVNGKENTEYENYVIQEKDKIELRYE